MTEITKIRSMSNSLTERRFLKTVSHSLVPESGNFKVETDYSSERGYPLDNSRHTDNAS